MCTMCAFLTICRCVQPLRPGNKKSPHPVPSTPFAPAVLAATREQVYRALEEQRIATEGSLDPLPAPATGGFPRAEFFTSNMPRLPPSLAAASSSPYGGGSGSGADGGGNGSGGGGGGGDILAEGGGAAAVEPERAVNVLAMERLGDNLMTLSQVNYMRVSVVGRIPRYFLIFLEFRRFDDGVARAACHREPRKILAPFRSRPIDR